MKLDWKEGEWKSKRRMFELGASLEGSSAKNTLSAYNLTQLTLGGEVPRGKKMLYSGTDPDHTAGYDGVFGGLDTESRLRYP